MEEIERETRHDRKAKKEYERPPYCGMVINNAGKDNKPSNKANEK